MSINAVKLLLCTISAAFLLTGSEPTIPYGWPEPVYALPTGEEGAARAMLGRALFYDPLLSSDNTVSCASCHSQTSAFAHNDHKLSHGIADRIGTRNAPALQNLAWKKTFMWDGAVHHIDAQALAPISNFAEMDESLPHIIAKLRQSRIYPELFKKAYGDTAMTGERTLKALSGFMLTLISANSKYDKVMRKENGFSFTESEQRGYSLFEQNCASCHAGPLFTNDKFESNGLAEDPALKDIGRGTITGKKSDNGLFKVPSLRNVELTYPYMHDGRFPNLQMVLFHYTEGIKPSNKLSHQLRKKISLNEQDKGDLINFLKTLTDEQFITDSRYSYPRQILRPSP